MRSTSSFFVVSALLLAGCTTTAPPTTERPLYGDWAIELPTLPRTHGNRIGFRDGCLLVAGNRFDMQVIRPVAYLPAGTQTLFWFGPPADREPRSSANAARVTFLAPDRIRVAWPEGIEARYMRAINTDASETDCR